MYSLTDAAMIQLGQMGSALLDTDSGTLTPPGGKVVVAISMMSDCQFDILVADGDDAYIGTGGAGAGGGVTLASGDTFPAGMTIYGRWSSVSVNTDGQLAICYMGD
jgi:hypothetical protein